jgi:hypothetical protein
VLVSLLALAADGQSVRERHSHSGGFLKLCAHFSLTARCELNHARGDRVAGTVITKIAGTAIQQYQKSAGAARWVVGGLEISAPRLTLAVRRRMHGPHWAHRHLSPRNVLPLKSFPIPRLAHRPRKPEPEPGTRRLCFLRAATRRAEPSSRTYTMRRCSRAPHMRPDGHNHRTQDHCHCCTHVVAVFCRGPSLDNALRPRFVGVYVYVDV